MTSYTVKNLREVEDSARTYGMPEGMEARFAHDALGCEQTGVSYQKLAPGFQQPFAHRHGRVEEIYVVLSGSGRLRLDDDEVEVGPLDAIRIAPPTVRAIAAGPDGLEFLAFGPQGSGDAEML